MRLPRRFSKKVTGPLVPWRESSGTNRAERSSLREVQPTGRAWRVWTFQGCESQRDSIIQPKVDARERGYLGNPIPNKANPERVREMLHTNDPVIERKCANGEICQERIKSYLCGSVPVQKSLAEPAGQCRGGCSQCVSAMGRSEGASQRYSGEWRFSLIDARVPALTAKRTGGPSAPRPLVPTDADGYPVGLFG